MEQSEYIAKLIYRHLVGDLSEEEQKTLDDWIAANPSHRTLYERLLNEDYLKQQYNRRRAINYHRPMKAMKARILVERSDNKMTKALGGRKAMLSLSKRLRDSILSPFFHSYIFAMYKNEALWI